MSRLLTFPAQRTGKFIVLIAALVVVAALSPLSGKFEDAQDNETVEWLPGDAESVKALKAIERFPDGEISPAVTVITRAGGLTADDRARAQQLVEDLNADPPPHTRGTQGPIPSQDGQAVLVVTQVENTGGTGDEFLDSVKSVRERAHALRGD